MNNIFKKDIPVIIVLADRSIYAPMTAAASVIDMMQRDLVKVQQTAANGNPILFSATSVIKIGPGYDGGLKQAHGCRIMIQCLQDFSDAIQAIKSYSKYDTWYVNGSYEIMTEQELLAHERTTGSCAEQPQEQEPSCAWLRCIFG